MPSTKQEPRKPIDNLIRKIQKESLDKNSIYKINRPLPKAPPELWPGESLDENSPGRFLLAKAKSRKRRPLERFV